MNSLQLITKLKSKANDINESVLQLFTEQHQLSEIDKELLKKQSVEFYELVLKLKTSLSQAPIMDEKPVETEYKPNFTIVTEDKNQPIIEKPIIKDNKPENTKPIIDKLSDFKQIVTEANEDEISLNQIEQTVTPEKEIELKPEPQKIILKPVAKDLIIDKPFEKATENKRIQYTVMPSDNKPKEETPLTINERLAQLNKNQTIETKIDSLKTAITLNKKIAFVNDLFKENVVEYAKAIDKCNTAVDLHEALNYFNIYKNQFNWDDNNALATELETLIKRRFK